MQDPQLTSWWLAKFERITMVGGIPTKEAKMKLLFQPREAAKGEGKLKLLFSSYDIIAYVSAQICEATVHESLL